MCTEASCLVVDDDWRQHAAFGSRSSCAERRESWRRCRVAKCAQQRPGADPARPSGRPGLRAATTSRWRIQSAFGRDSVGRCRAGCIAERIDGWSARRFRAWPEAALRSCSMVSVSPPRVTRYLPSWLSLKASTATSRERTSRHSMLCPAGCRRIFSSVSR